MSYDSFRDKYGHHGFGTFGDRPQPSEDIRGMIYTVVSGATNLGKRYVCNGTLWTEIPVPEHTHDQYMTELPVHDNEHHDPDYLSELLAHTHPQYLEAVPVHGNDKHSGVCSCIPWGFSMLESAACPAGVTWSRKIHKIAISGTTVFFQNLYIDLATAPSSPITFTVKKNGETLDTVTVAASATAGTTALSEEETITDDDEISVEFPANAYSAAGPQFSIDLQRRFNAS